MPHGPHSMLGAGGRIIVPKSEGLEIGAIIRLVKQGHSDAAISRLEKLQEQVIGGYHRNPRGFVKGGQFQAGTVVGKIGDDVHDVRYTHASDGEHYEHQFGGDVEVWAVQRNGKRDLLLTHIKGSPLWDEF